MARDIGIDLGTANTLIYMKGKGIILREPSVVAVDIRNDTVKFVGNEAKEVIGRTPASIVAVRPLKDGVIADFDIAASMLQLFIRKTLGSVTFNRPRIVICIPSGVTAVERRAVREVAFKAGARQVAIVEEPMAAAIGAGLPGPALTCFVLVIITNYYMHYMTRYVENHTRTMEFYVELERSAVTELIDFIKDKSG